MREDFESWNALPKDVARWWRDRHESQLKRQGNSWIITGPASNRGRILEVGLEKNHSTNLSIKPLNQFI